MIMRSIDREDIIIMSTAEKYLFIRFAGSYTERS